MTKACFFLGIFFFMLLTANAQKEGQGRIDSLLIQLSTAKEDTNKVNLLTDLSHEYSGIKADEGLKYGMKGLALAEKLKWEKGIAYSNLWIGNNHYNKQEFSIAKEYFLSTLKYFEKIKNKTGEAHTLNDLGDISYMLFDYSNGLKYYFKAMKLAEETGDKYLLAATLSNTGNIYDTQKDYPRALEYFFKALKLAEETGNKGLISHELGSIGLIYFELKDYSRAIEFSSRSLKVHEEIGNKVWIAGLIQDIGQDYQGQKNYPKALEYYFKALKMNIETESKNLQDRNLGVIGSVYLTISRDTAPESILELKKLFGGSKKAALLRAKYFLDSSVTVTKRIKNEINNTLSFQWLSEVQYLLGDYKGALENYKIYNIISDSVFNMEKNQKLTQTAMQYEFDKKEVATKSEQEKKDINQRNIRNSITVGFTGALLFLVVVYRQRNKIANAKKRSDELLLNILPAETAEELKKTGTTAAKDFDEVTVMFTDFKDFTAMSEKLSAQELLNEINYCYIAFDNIITKHGIEKIKTIGDSYMCAGGLPVANKTNAEETVRAALEIRDFMEEEKHKRLAANLPYFEIRIGCNTGPVVAGIVGIKKFAYDIWGDTVNIASRMESSSEVGKVNVSGSTYELVKNKFTCVHRGKIQAKNKGEIDMYFAEAVS